MFQFRSSFLFFVALFWLHVGLAPAHGADSVVTRSTLVKSTPKAAVDLEGRKMWHLKLKTASVGLIICYASKDDFLAEASIASFLSSKDMGGFTIYNDMKKLYTTLTDTDIKTQLRSISRQGSFNKRISQSIGWQFLPPKLIGSEMLKGMHTKVYTQENIFQLSYTSKHIAAKTWYLDQAEFNQMPEGVAMIIAKIAKSHSVDRRIPLRETIHTFTLKRDGTILKDDGTKLEMDVLSMKKEPFDATKFEVPKGYTFTTNQMTVLGLETEDGRRNY